MANITQESVLTETQQKAFRMKVKQALLSYDEIGKKLRDRVIEYLVEGGDATCLLELSAAYQDDKRKRFFKQQNGIHRATDRVERKRLLGLLEIDEPAAGYYRRLGEVAGHVPEVSGARFEYDDRCPKWFNDLIGLRQLLSADHFYHHYGGNKLLSSFKLKACLADLDAECPIATMIEMVVNAESTIYTHISRFLRTAGDWGEILSENPSALSDALLAAPAASREATLIWLSERKFDFSPLLPTIAQLAVSNSKKVRPLALNILRKHPEQARNLLSDQLASKVASDRCNAAEALVAIMGEEAEESLREALKNEKGKRVKQTIESLLVGLSDDRSEESSGEAEIAFDLPPIEMPSGELPLPAGFADQLWEQLEAAFAKLDQQYQKQVDAFKSPDRPRWMGKPKKPVYMTKKEFAKVIAYIEGKADNRPSASNWTRQAMFAMPVWSKWTDPSNLHLLHVVRFLNAFQLLEHYHRRMVRIVREEWLETHRSAESEPYGLREVDAAVATLPKSGPGMIAATYLQSNTSWSSFLDWEGDAVWPVFAEHGDVFRDSILGVSHEKNDYYVGERRRAAIRVAGMMPKLPREIENAMWSVALGEGKTDRPAARQALHAADGRAERAIAALGDGKQGIRIAAAEMLGELDDPVAIDALKKALKKEKQEIVKGTMLQAIEKLGGDVDEFLGRRKQLLDAKKGLEKKRPKGMEWVPLDSLPQVRWAEDNKPVANEILQWWVIQSIQFKLPTCGAILRRSMAMCRPDDAAAFAKHVLSVWIGYDTKTPSAEEVLAEATKTAAQHWKGGGKWLQEYYKTEENYRDQLISQMQNNFLQSAIGQKGLLAIVSAAGDAECVKLIERYIRTYHGHRLAQSKALLETLGWIEDSTAVQVLLSLANRFRTKAIRKRAEEMVRELADRQGWTMDQLADRTIPDAGFARETDEDGNPVGDRAELVLDYGSRKFSVILGDDLQAVITRDDGKSVKSLPSAAKDDDPELVKAAKKEFSAAKKTVKEVVKSQAERLYEAACIGRSWPADDWRQVPGRASDRWGSLPASHLGSPAGG